MGFNVIFQFLIYARAYVIHYWEKFGPMIKRGRQIMGTPLAFDDVDKAYSQLRKQYQQRLDASQ
jgi:hypothetical protein